MREVVTSRQNLEIKDKLRLVKSGKVSSIKEPVANYTAINTSRRLRAVRFFPTDERTGRVG